MPLPPQEDPDSAGKFDFDWWSKYYYSIGDDRRTQKEYVEKGYDRLVVYPTELEESFNRQVAILVVHKELTCSAQGVNLVVYVVHKGLTWCMYIGSWI